MSVPPPKKRPKVVVFDMDETLGNFSQFSIFCHVLEEYFNKPDIIYRHFNDLVDLYPEIIRPSMLRILEYIRKKKNAGVCSKVMIYTNNVGPDKWVGHIRQYFEYKLRATAATAASGDLAIIPPLFGHTIGGFKPQNAASASASASAFPQRTTKEKTVRDFIRCSRLPADIEICFLDDVYHPKMTEERVYYIKLQAYHFHIPFQMFVVRFLNSRLYRDVFDGFSVPSVTSALTAAAKKQVLSIELHDLFVKYANMSEYDVKSQQRKMNPREIDEIISKYILYHLQQFFRDGPTPTPPRSLPSSSILHQRTKTSKKNRYSGTGHTAAAAAANVFYVDKTTAVKNMRNKTVRNR
jgi:hypothetical protein